MNLLFIISGLERGGTELRLLDFARSLPADIGFHLCATSDQQSLLAEFRKCTENIACIPVKRPYMEPRRIGDIGRYIKGNNIEIVNTFELKGLLIAVSLKLFGGSRIRIVHHVVSVLHNYRLRHKLLLFSLLRFVDHVICNSMEARKVLNAYVNDKRMRTIHNGIDVSRFKKGAAETGLKKRLGIKDGDIVVGTVANLRREKNYPFLLDAFTALSLSYPNLRLLCVGGGMLLDSMRKLAQQHAISDRVIFAGYVEDVREYLDVMDIFVLCSLKESLPNALIQAMSMEIPVVSSRVGGCPEIVDHLVNGILYEPNSSDDFKRWLIRLMKDEEFASELSLKGRMKIEEAFSLEAMMGSYADFYRTLAVDDGGEQNGPSKSRP